MLIENLNEPVKVRADFKGGEIVPLAFKRNGKVFHISKVNAQWKDREGTFVRYYFSVRSNGTIYELHLDSGDMGWRLDRVCLE